MIESVLGPNPQKTQTVLDHSQHRGLRKRGWGQHITKAAAGLHGSMPHQQDQKGQTGSTFEKSISVWLGATTPMRRTAISSAALRFSFHNLSSLVAVQQTPQYAAITGQHRQGEFSTNIVKIFQSNYNKASTSLSTRCCFEGKSPNESRISGFSCSWRQRTVPSANSFCFSPIVRVVRVVMGNK